MGIIIFSGLPKKEMQGLSLSVAAAECGSI